jgi:hypothetical protein
MDCIFIGDDFYYKSKSMMSSIYKIESKGYSRTDWGKVNVCLRNGESVHIRPATEQEMELFLKNLNDVEERLSDLDNKG